ncbi:hypothetical protein, conserved [Leishmania tarentolae]|uniref:Uncharacterized protein n=1 Tax=Leishmania tarentolae TaxID=5689 RepID=A0A640KJJ3_LEITA|nr:hypothetical protein, conserved [Leishmania tarentolae]
MDPGVGSDWDVVGTYRKRPVPQGPIVDFASDLSHYNSLDNTDAPILLYEVKADENLPQSRVQLYMACNIEIPPHSVLKMKVVSLALMRHADAGVCCEDLFFIDCPEPRNAHSHRRDHAH